MDDEVRAALAKASEKERADAREQIATNVMARQIGTRRGEAHVETVLYFFTRLAICVEAELCSRKASKAYFKDMTESFWDYFGPYAVTRREESSSTYGIELDRYLAE